ncbi:MAG: hypothetical protein LBU60_03430 [Clostridiales bacterium]|jgi:hypothetical protein|nr:hypothetical protein [Clostridiales bacterium]
MDKRVNCCGCSCYCVVATVTTFGVVSPIGAAIVAGTIAAGSNLFIQTAIQSKDWNQVNWGSVAIFGLVGAVTAGLGVGAGRQ